jgi:hypothetical protein
MKKGSIMNTQTRHKSALSPTEKLIINALAEGDTMSLAEINASTGASSHTVRRACQRLVRIGALTRTLTAGIAYFAISAKAREGSEPATPKTDVQIEQWMADRRREYAEGTLPQWRIKRIEQIPGWVW